ncbi:MAG: hypothetical protein RL177_1401 [Bacteroidota bacterium]|jgi:hypothetical protein
MKHLLLAITFITFAPGLIFAQEFDPAKTYVVTKNDGTKITGNILSSDAREVLLKTTTIGEIIIPKHEIRSIVEFQPGDDKYKEIFASRYFITTNGLPVEKGDSYVQWTLLGPDIQFGASDNIGIGVMTTWVANPVALSFKYSGNLGHKLNFAVGTLAGSTLWSGGDGVRFALPFAAVTIGDENANLNVALGYGFASYDTYSGSQAMFSLGAMKKVTRSGSLVFDSLVFPSEGESVALIVPGFRIQTQEKSAFQFGFPGFVTSGDSSPVGFPMVSWFRKF